MTIGHFQSTTNAFGIKLVVNLDGTDPSPEPAVAVDTSPAAAVAGWRFKTNGDMEKSSGNPDSWNAWEPTPDAWTDPSRVSIGSSYWIRFTNHTGTNPNGGASLGVWHPLSTQREVRWEQTSIGTISGAVKVEISSDASGTPIVATGYYSGSAEQESGG
jgi:hypothetical protein